MKSKATLVIIYNHSYPSNIEKLESYYGQRFTSIFHVIPFYAVNDSKVIPVFEISYMFIGHIANAWKEINKCQSEFYVFAGDDLLLNPSITSENIHEYFAIDSESAYIHEIFPLSEVSEFWRRSVEAINWKPSGKSVELPNYFPNEESVRRAIELRGEFDSVLPRRSIMRKLKWSRNTKFRSNISSNIWNLYWNAKYFRRGKRTLNFPMVGGYSDLVIIPGKWLKDFCSLCGVFNVLGLHTELAIPTILSYLFGKNISTEENLLKKAKITWNGTEPILARDFNFHLSELVERFPEEYSYLHPVKLSKWQV